MRRGGRLSRRRHPRDARALTAGRQGSPVRLRSGLDAGLGLLAAGEPDPDPAAGARRGWNTPCGEAVRVHLRSGLSDDLAADRGRSGHTVSARLRDRWGAKRHAGEFIDPSLLRWAVALAAVLITPAIARCEDTGPEPTPPDDTTVATTTPAPMFRPDRLEALGPELSLHPYSLAPGPRAFRHRISFSPGYGTLGSERLFSARLAYNPDSWLGYEASIGHNPGQSVHAVLHTLSAVVRHPLAGRFQPYLTAGYGMVLVFPGTTINAKPVTKNAVQYGGGLEFYIRSDLAIRAEVRQAIVFGEQRDRGDAVAFQYMQ